MDKMILLHNIYQLFKKHVFHPKFNCSKKSLNFLEYNKILFYTDYFDQLKDILKNHIFFHSKVNLKQYGKIHLLNKFFFNQELFI